MTEIEATFIKLEESLARQEALNYGTDGDWQIHNAKSAVLAVLVVQVRNLRNIYQTLEEKGVGAL